MVTSASISIADRQMHEPLHFLERQVVGVVLGLIGAAFMMFIPTTVWERLAMPLLLFGFLLLVMVLIPGHRTRSERQSSLAARGVHEFPGVGAGPRVVADLSRELRRRDVSRN